MRSHEPPTRTPQVVRAARREGTLRAFLKPTLWTLATSVGLVAVTAIVTMRATRTRDSSAAPDPGSFAALRDAPLEATAPGITAATTTGATSRPHAFPPAAELTDAGRAALAAVDDVERERAGGDLSVARKRFDPCPGEDVERVAWIDVWSRIVKLSSTRAGPQPVTVEHWFDREGRLRGARATRAGEGGWSVSALFDEDGAAVQEGAAGAAPSLAELRLVSKDPSSAFFETPRCDAGEGGVAR